MVNKATRAILMILIFLKFRGSAARRHFQLSADETGVEDIGTSRDSAI